MRGLVGLAIVGLVAIGGMYYLMNEASKDPGIPVAFAVGNHDGEKMQAHLCVQPGMTMTEGPRRDLRGTVYWDEWAEEHFKVVDEKGERAPITFRAGSNLISEQKAGGVPEGFLSANIRTGGDYTIDYKPRKGESKTYRHKFKAEAGPMSRPNFELVSGG